jgi:hypothetical protein
MTVCVPYAKWSNLRGIFFEKKAVIQDLQKRKGEIKYE